MENRSQPDPKSNNRMARFRRIPPQTSVWIIRAVAAIILAVLQIFLLLLKAHFSKDEDNEAARKHTEAAQAKLNEVAETFEEKIRYSEINPHQMDQFQDDIDKEIKNHDSTSHH